MILEDSARHDPRAAGRVERGRDRTKNTASHRRRQPIMVLLPTASSHADLGSKRPDLQAGCHNQGYRALGRSGQGPPRNIFRWRQDHARGGAATLTEPGALGRRQARLRVTSEQLGQGSNRSGNSGDSPCSPDQQLHAICARLVPVLFRGRVGYDRHRLEHLSWVFMSRGLARTGPLVVVGLLVEGQASNGHGGSLEGVKTLAMSFERPSCSGLRPCWRHGRQAVPASCNRRRRLARLTEPSVGAAFQTGCNSRRARPWTSGCALRRSTSTRSSSYLNVVVGYARVVDVQPGRSRIRIEFADGRVFRPRPNELWARASRRSP
jgi:hypothetical protein